MRFADHFLDDDRHFFVGGIDSCRTVIISRVAKIDGCINQPDCFHQAAETGIGVGLIVGDHLGEVDSSERLVHGVLEHAGRADRQGFPDRFDQPAQITDEFRGEFRFLEIIGDKLVGFT